MNSHKLSVLRPTGNPIILSNSEPVSPAPTVHELLQLDRYTVYWVSSGTAALGLAILGARARRTIQTPEVILPAYGCPDLVAATLFAEATPVLVDIQANSPTYDQDQLRAAITPNTVAIVAATLLGIRGNESALREIIGDRPIALIEDSAQWIPRTPEHMFFGDFVVLSFGRGKPVNLLTGGALLVRNPLPANILSAIERPRYGRQETIRYLGKLLAYNLLIHPFVYGAIEKIPFLEIGETRLHELPGIATIIPAAQRLLASNLHAYCRCDLYAQSQWRIFFQELHRGANQGSYLDLIEHHLVSQDYGLLRYPIIVYAGRDRIYGELRRHGLGASTMYPAALPEIAGIPAHACKISSYANARLFAQRLLTLPTHQAVDSAIVAKTAALLECAQ